MTKQKVNQTLPSFLLQMSSRLSCLTFWRTFHTQQQLNFLPIFFFFKTSERREGQNNGTENTRLQFYYCWKRKTGLLMFLIYTMNDPCGNIMQSLALRALHTQWLQQEEAEDLTMDTQHRFTPRKYLWERTATRGASIAFSGIFSVDKHCDFVSRINDLAAFLRRKFSQE